MERFMLGTGELIIIFGAILLLFGGKKLPDLARGLGQGVREFRSALNDKGYDNREDSEDGRREK